MHPTIKTISLPQLAIALIPVLLVLGILFRWSIQGNRAVYAVSRMLVQLLLVGFILSYLFESDRGTVVLLVLAVMVFSSSWIALGTVADKRFALYKHALGSITLCGGATLFLVTQGVLRLDPWYWPRFFIPLAGMIFANAMNSVSLAAERLQAETDRGVGYEEARQIALRAALVPIINSLFAVGLVSVPGMMTGQILSGVSPLIAARYQIMVMCMIFGASGSSAACFLTIAKPVFTKPGGANRQHGGEK